MLGGIVGDADDSDEDEPPGGIVGVARQAVVGYGHRPCKFLAVIIHSADEDARFAHSLAGEVLPDRWAALEAELLASPPSAIGVAWVSASLRPPSHEFGHASCLQEAALQCIAKEAQGYVVYEIEHVQALEEPVLASDIEPADLWELIKDRVADDGRPLLQHVAEWSGGYDREPICWKVCTKLAVAATRSVWPLLHVCAFTGRMKRCNLMSAFPSCSTLQRFRAELARAVQNLDGETARVGVNPFSGVRADEILAWIDATSYIKSLQQCKVAAGSFARLLIRSGSPRLEDVLPAHQIANPEMLRKARIRFDLVSMLILRDYLRTVHNPVLYLWADSSPQWRGLEYFASSFDLYAGGSFHRRLLPCVQLTRQRTSALHKTLALLWQILLITGPSGVQSYCRSVRGIITDMGTERNIAKTPIAVLVGFFRHLGCPIFVALDSPWLFPSALMIPGWKHGIDLLIRKGLWTLPCFPKFIKLLKAVVSFLREDIYNVSSDLRKRGFPGLADLMDSTSLPSFASWRWETLHECLESIQRFHSSWSVAFDPSLFKTSRDKTKLALVCEALRCPLWREQLVVVSWFCQIMTSLLRWGSGCRCHRADDPGRADCQFKGRLLPEAFPKAMLHLEEALREIDGWDENVVGDVPILRSGQAAMRATWLMAKEKLAHYDHIPWLLGRLDQPGVRDRCLLQFAEAPEAKHEPVSLEFLSPASALYEDVTRMHADGTGMSPKLWNAFDSIRQTPIDDTPAEAPHAAMRHTALKSRAASWAFHAASARLTQNKADHKELLPLVEPATDMQWYWDRWSSVLQMSGKRSAHRCARLSRHTVYEQVYTMRRFQDFDVTDMDIADHESDGGHDDGDDDGKPGDGEAEHEDNDIGDFARLLTDFYGQAMPSRVGGFFTVRTEVDGAARDRPFQLVSFRPALVLVKSHRKAKRYACKLGVLWLETWSELAGCYLEVFQIADPVYIDLADFVRTANDREHLKRWEEQPSDVSGCTSLVRPQPLEVHTKLNSKTCPVLCLVDALVSAGYHFVDSQVVHTPEAGLKVADGRQQSAKRHYYQCILAKDEIFARGVASFKSTSSQSFFWLLLNNRAEGLNKENRRKRLAELDSNHVELLSLSRPAKLHRHAAGHEGIVGDVADGEESPEEPAEEEPEEAVAAEEGPAEVVPAEEPAGDGIVGDDDDDAFVVPKTICGARVRVECHGAIRGMRIICNKHGGCRRYHSLAKDRYGHGPRAAEFWLGAWLLLDKPAYSHFRSEPTQEQVEAFRAAHS